MNQSSSGGHQQTASSLDRNDLVNMNKNQDLQTRGQSQLIMNG